MEIDHAEPVVVSCLRLVPSCSVKEGGSAEVHSHGSVEKEIDCLKFKASAAACHGSSNIYVYSKKLLVYNLFEKD